MKAFSYAAGQTFRHSGKTVRWYRAKHIFRPSTGQWFVLRSEDFSFYSFPFGTNGDIPVPGDYDGDGRNDAAVFRPSTSTWFAQRSTAGTLIQQFGITGDIPLPSAYVR